MKTFAVLLASVAALAATVQAYLNWSYWRDSDATRPELYRQQTCDNVISLYTRAQTSLAEDEVKRRIEFLVDQYLQRQPETPIERAESRARETIMREFYPGPWFWGRENLFKIYFDEAEYDAIGFASLVELGGWNFRYDYDVTKAEFDAKVKGLAKASTSLPSAIEACTPILLGK